MQSKKYTLFLQIIGFPLKNIDKLCLVLNSSTNLIYIFYLHIQNQHQALGYTVSLKIISFSRVLPTWSSVQTYPW